jgi:hypothetical protein
MGMTDTHFIKRQKMFSDFSFVLCWAPRQIATGALPSRSSKDFKVRACKIPSMASLGTWRAANSFSISDRGSFSICQQTNPCQWDLLESVKKVGTHKLQFPPSVTILNMEALFSLNMEELKRKYWFVVTVTTHQIKRVGALTLSTITQTAAKDSSGIE